LLAFHFEACIAALGGAQALCNRAGTRERDGKNVVAYAYASELKAGFARNIFCIFRSVPSRHPCEFLSKHKPHGRNRQKSGSIIRRALPWPAGAAIHAERLSAYTRAAPDQAMTPRRASLSILSG